MVWLYVAELEASNEELNPSLLISEPFVMSRGKPMRPLALSRKWKKDGYMRRLSGLTLEPSTANLGVEKWILSLEDSLVSHSAKQGSKKEKTMKDTSGQISQESLAKYNHQSSSWKMSQMSLITLEPISLEIWPKWGIIRHGELFEHQTPTHLINGRDSSQYRSIPTPTTMDCHFTSSKRTVMVESLERGLWRGVGLKDFAQMFPTPTTKMRPCEGSIRLYRNQFFAGKLTLQEASMMAGKDITKKHGKLPKMYPTPTARDWKSGDASQKTLKKNSRPLNEVIKSNESQPGQLNPNWVEWLMGWPIGWTDCEPVETELSPNKQD